MLLLKFSKYINLFLFSVLIIEYLLLTCAIDLFPLLFCGVVCGFFIIVNNRNKMRQSSHVIISQEETSSIVSYIVLTFVVLLIMGIYIIRGLPAIWGSFSLWLDNSHIFRYVIYGLIYPILSSLFITYCITDVNPFEQLMINVFIIVLFITLFMGLGICMYWESYRGIAGFLVNLF